MSSLHLGNCLSISAETVQFVAYSLQKIETARSDEKKSRNDSRYRSLSLLSSLLQITTCHLTMAFCDFTASMSTRTGLKTSQLPLATKARRPTGHTSCLYPPVVPWSSAHACPVVRGVSDLSEFYSAASCGRFSSAKDMARDQEPVFWA